MDPWQQIDEINQRPVEAEAQKRLQEMKSNYRGWNDCKLGRALHRIMLATATLQLQKGRDSDWEVSINSFGVAAHGSSDYDDIWHNEFGDVDGTTVEHFEALADKLEAQLG